MTWPFAILAGLTAGSAVAAMTLRNLVHCALSLVLTFVGLAALYLQLNAEFVGFVQILVYVGAVAILIVFAILLTRGTEPATPAPITTALPWAVSIAVAVFVMIAGAVVKSPIVAGSPAHLIVKVEGIPVTVPIHDTKPKVAPVKTLGESLMTQYVIPLEVVGLLLTAAMIGAVIIALQDKRPESAVITAGKSEAQPAEKERS